jgi:hypothetical protein
MRQKECKGQLDENNRPFKEFRPATHSLTASLNGVIELGGAGKDLFDLVDNLLKGELLDFKVQGLTPPSTTSDLLLSVVMVEGVDVQTPDNETATFSLNLSSVDAVTGSLTT